MVGMGQKDSYVGDEAQSKRGILTLKYPVEHGIITNWDDMEKVWAEAFKESHWLPKEKGPILTTESPNMSKEERAKMAEIFFETFNFPAMAVNMDSVLSLYSTGRTSGLVVSSGDGVTNVTPIQDGFVLGNAIRQTDLCGRDITKHLNKLLNKKGCNLTTSGDQDVVREIKEKLCYLAFEPEEEQAKEKKYTLPDGREITLAEERFRAPEAIFNPKLLSKEALGLHKIVHNSITECDINLRRGMFGSILLSGGNTMFRGIEQRLEKELVSLAPSTVKIGVVAPPERKNSVWIGGSILASLSSFREQWVTRDQYREIGAAAFN